MSQRGSGLRSIIVVIVISVMTPNHIYSEDPILDLQIMSFNIRYGTARDGRNSWKNRRELVCDIFRSHKPDIAGTQEALRFQLDEIRADLGHFGEVGVGREDGKESGEYAAILYNSRKFKICDSGTFWFSEKPQTRKQNLGQQ